MRLEDLNAGDMVAIDQGFTCHPGGPALVWENAGRLFFFCKCGFHYLDGQVDDVGNLVGLSWPGTAVTAKRCRCGGTVTFSVPTKSVGYTHVTPGLVSTTTAVRLHGAEGKCDRCGNPYVVRIKSPQDMVHLGIDDV